MNDGDGSSEAVPMLNKPVQIDELLHLRQFHKQATVPGLNRRKLSVPAFDQSFLVLDLSQLQKLRSQRGLTNLVRLRLTVGSSHSGLRFAIGFGNSLCRLCLGLRQFVARA